MTCQAWLVGGGGVVIGSLVYGLVVLGLKVPEVQSVYQFAQAQAQASL